MKTYVLDILNRIRRKSEELDAKTILTNKAWKIFNDDGDEETIYFLENGKLRVSINGITTSGTWELFVEDKSVHIMYEGQKNGILLKPKFDANGILAMQLDGTNNYSFLIDKKNDNLNNIKTLSDLNNFYKQIEQAEEEKEKQKQLLIEARKAEEERERKRLEYKRAEQEKQRKLEEKRLEEIRQKRLYIQKCKRERTEIASKYSNVSKIFNACNYSVNEMVNKLNVFYKNKNFLKFIRWYNILQYYNLYEPEIYTGYYYNGKRNFTRHLLCILLVLIMNIVLYSITVVIMQEEESMWIFILIISLLWSVFTIWLLKGMIAEMVLDKRVQFLKKNEYKYKWYDHIIFQEELLETKSEVIEEINGIKNRHIIDKYIEIITKRHNLIVKGSHLN